MLSLTELSAVVNLTSVDFQELTARRTDEPDRSGAQRSANSELSISATRRNNEISVHCGLDHVTTEASFRVAVVATFHASESFEIEDAVMTAFVQEIGLVTLYPFIRQAVHRLSSDLVGAPVILGLLQPGQLRLGLDGKTTSS